MRAALACVFLVAPALAATGSGTDEALLLQLQDAETPLQASAREARARVDELEEKFEAKAADAHAKAEELARKVAEAKRSPKAMPMVDKLEPAHSFILTEASRLPNGTDDKPQVAEPAEAQKAAEEAPAKETEETPKVEKPKVEEAPKAEEAPKVEEAQRKEGSKEVPAEIVHTLSDMDEATFSSGQQFQEYHEKVTAAAERLAQDFSKQRSAITDMKQESDRIESQRKSEKQKMLGQLDEFKKRTLEKFAELQTQDRTLEDANKKFVGDNERLSKNLEAERKKKEALMQELQRMASLFKHQSAQMQDLVSQRKSHLESQVSSTLEEARAVAGDGKDDATKASLLEVETTTLVLR